MVVLSSPIYRPTATHGIPIRRFDTISAFSSVPGAICASAAIRIGCYFTNHRTYARHTNNKNQPVGKDSKNEVCNRTCGNNRRSLANRFIIEGMVAECRNDRFCALIQHFDITAQRDQGDNIFGADLSVRRQSALPNPIEKRSTRTPQRRATQK